MGARFEVHCLFHERSRAKSHEGSKRKIWRLFGGSRRLSDDASLDRGVCERKRDASRAEATDGREQIQRGRFFVVAGWESHCVQRAKRPGFDFYWHGRFVRRKRERQGGKENCHHVGAGHESALVAGREEDRVPDFSGITVLLLYGWQDWRRFSRWRGSTDSDGIVRRRSFAHRLGTGRNLFWGCPENNGAPV